MRLAFGGREERFQEFLAMIREDIPPGTSVVLRGSAVTGDALAATAPRSMPMVRAPAISI